MFAKLCVAPCKSGWAISLPLTCADWIKIMASWNLCIISNHYFCGRQDNVFNGSVGVAGGLLLSLFITSKLGEYFSHVGFPAITTYIHSAVAIISKLVPQTHVLAMFLTCSKPCFVYGSMYTLKRCNFGLTLNDYFSYSYRLRWWSSLHQWAEERVLGRGSCHLQELSQLFFPVFEEKAGMRTAYLVGGEWSILGIMSSGMRIPCFQVILHTSIEDKVYIFSEWYYKALCRYFFTCMCVT